MLDINGHSPLYEQIYEDLKAGIMLSAPGKYLLPERNLSEQYNVDRVTIRRALSKLQEEGYIARTRGRGTQIIKRPSRDEDSILFVLSQSASKVDRISEPFYAGTLDELERVFRSDHKRLIYSSISQNDNLQELCESVAARAIVFAGKPTGPLLRQCYVSHIPVIMYNNRVSGIPCIWTDNEEAALASVECLLQENHQHTAFLHVTGYANSDRRLAHVQKALLQMNAPHAMVFECDEWTEEAGYAAAKEVAKNQRITALFCGNDSMAYGASRAYSEAGRSVPDDVSIIGFDGVSSALPESTRFATFSIDLALMAESTNMLLNHYIKTGSKSCMQVVISVVFQPNDSIAAACQQTSSLIHRR